MSAPDDLKKFIGENVIVDTDSHLLYLGKLTDVAPGHITLEDVDVHSHHDAHSSREIYLMDAKKFGIRQNRTATVVLMSRIVGISRLDDVTSY